MLTEAEVILYTNRCIATKHRLVQKKFPHLLEKLSNTPHNSVAKPAQCLV